MSTVAYNLYDPGVATFGWSPKLLNVGGTFNINHFLTTGVTYTTVAAWGFTGTATALKCYIYYNYDIFDVYVDGSLTTIDQSPSYGNYASIGPSGLSEGDHWVEFRVKRPADTVNLILFAHAEDSAITVTGASPAIRAHPDFPGFDNSNTPAGGGWHKITVEETSGIQLPLSYFHLDSTNPQILNANNARNTGPILNSSDTTVIRVFSRGLVTLFIDGVLESTQGSSNLYTFKEWTGFTPGTQYRLEANDDTAYEITEIYIDGTYGTTPALPRIAWTGTSYEQGEGTNGESGSSWSYVAQIAHTLGYNVSNWGQAGTTLEENGWNIALAAGDLDGPLNLPLSDANLTIIIGPPINNIWSENGSSGAPFATAFGADCLAFFQLCRAKFPLSKILVSPYPVAVTRPDIADFNTAITDAFNTWGDGNSIFLTGWEDLLAVSGDLSNSHPSRPQGAAAVTAYLTPFLNHSPTFSNWQTDSTGHSVSGNAGGSGYTQLTGGASVSVNGSTIGLNDEGFNGDVWTFSLQSPYAAYGDTVTVSFPAGTVADSHGNPNEDIINAPVTNNVIPPVAINAVYISPDHAGYVRFVFSDVISTVTDISNFVIVGPSTLACTTYIQIDDHTLDMTTGTASQKGWSWFFTTPFSGTFQSGGQVPDSSGTIGGIPDAPVLIGVAGSGDALLQWGAISDATSYSVYQDGTPIATSIGDLLYLVTGLSNGTPYTFTVTATNVAGESAPSNAKVLTPTANPGSGGGGGGGGGAFRTRRIVLL